MTKSIIVHGPKGCGKTRDGAAIAKALGLSRVVELDEKPLRVTGRKLPTLEAEGVVYLTNNSSAAARLSGAQGLHVCPYELAMQKVAQ